MRLSMRSIATVFSLLCVSLTAEESVSKVAFSELKGTIRAFSSSGEITLPTIRVQLEIRHAGGKNEHGDLLVVHDTQSGHYFWRYARANHVGDARNWLTELESGRATVYTTPGAIFFIYMPGNLWVQEHRGSSLTLDGAESASIEEIQRMLPVFASNGYDTGMKEVVLARAIGMEFACSSERSEISRQCGFGIKSFVSISREGDGWRLILRNRWDQEVILDSLFNLVSTRRLPDAGKQ
jgi:hypothetical protein